MRFNPSRQNPLPPCSVRRTASRGFAPTSAQARFAPDAADSTLLALPFKRMSRPATNRYTAIIVEACTSSSMPRSASAVPGTVNDVPRLGERALLHAAHRGIGDFLRSVFRAHRLDIGGKPHARLVDMPEGFQSGLQRDARVLAFPHARGMIGTARPPPSAAGIAPATDRRRSRGREDRRRRSRVPHRPSPRASRNDSAPSP